MSVAFGTARESKHSSHLAGPLGFNDSLLENSALWHQKPQTLNSELMIGQNSRDVQVESQNEDYTFRKQNDLLEFSPREHDIAAMNISD
jgi:hypothetical protein